MYKDEVHLGCKVTVFEVPSFSTNFLFVNLLTQVGLTNSSYLKIKFTKKKQGYDLTFLTYGIHYSLEFFSTKESGWPLLEKNQLISYRALNLDVVLYTTIMISERRNFFLQNIIGCKSYPKRILIRFFVFCLSNKLIIDRRRRTRNYVLKYFQNTAAKQFDNNELILRQ